MKAEPFQSFSDKKFYILLETDFYFKKLIKRSSIEAISYAKNEALTFLARERENIMKMGREEAVSLLIQYKNLDGREGVIRAGGNNDLLSMT